MKVTNIQNLIQMMQSPDQENHLLALSILEKQDHNKVTASLMLCYKFGRPSPEMWQEHAPNSYAHLLNQSDMKPYAGFSFQQIFATIIQPDASLDDILVYFDEYAKYLSGQCMHSKVKSIEIKVNLKDPNEQRREFSESF